jgi:hypothetical protein
MAFKNASTTLTSTLATVYTCPASTEAVIHAIYVTPHVASTTVDLKAAGGWLGEAIPVAYGGSFSFPKPVNLVAGETIQAKCDVSSDASIFLSVLEKAA